MQAVWPVKENDGTSFGWMESVGKLRVSDQV